MKAVSMLLMAFVISNIVTTVIGKKCLNPTNPLESGSPLPKVFCGTVPNRNDCPPGYTCKKNPAEESAECCQDECKLPIVTSTCGIVGGECWRFSEVNQECMQFQTGCCNDHPNQYKTLDQCQMSCKPGPVN